MSWEFWLGIFVGVIGTFFIALTMPIDTIKDVTERGFYTYKDQLYVVSPATPITDRKE